MLDLQENNMMTESNTLLPARKHKSSTQTLQYKIFTQEIIITEMHQIKICPPNILQSSKN